MNQMLTYYVVLRTKEKDEQFAEVDALTLDEARAIFDIRFKADKEAMQEGDAFFIFEADKALEFDKNNRVVFPSGKMVITHKF
ncbi:hypothetical protein J7I93_03730 [Bacillus sp. ISL-47]|uniref:hypothetical protein n=1 Tax=Bacillus sp. ISL-47 TaxID=2819130 RepID=UPI001BEA6532|nr:hypothetical protein [Bacillus sp. ISL-47]MBT2687287.1 hypothetical protein [Bacillus sp. ISL-47]MBT2706643.1 hypothetical protein [Pseudomonas sp. ISL-84]